VPDFKEREAPLASEVHHDHVHFLTRGAKITFPITPPPLVNHGNYIISLNRFVKWLGGLVEAEGIDVFTGFPAVEVLYENDRVVGVRTGDRRDQGPRKAGVRAGRGHPRQGHHPAGRRASNLTKAVVRALALDAACRSSMPSGSRSSGCRADPFPPGTVIHTMGVPLRMEEFSGGSSTACGRLAVS
jgi:electron-transferring-flavoprotein dehydrogenase